MHCEYLSNLLPTLRLSRGSFGLFYRHFPPFLGRLVLTLLLILLVNESATGQQIATFSSKGVTVGYQSREWRLEETENPQVILKLVTPSGELPSLNLVQMAGPSPYPPGKESARILDEYRVLGFIECSGKDGPEVVVGSQTFSSTLVRFRREDRYVISQVVVIPQPHAHLVLTLMRFESDREGETRLLNLAREVRIATVLPSQAGGGSAQSPRLHPLMVGLGALTFGLAIVALRRRLRR
jgi:hypothetical protein